MRALILASLFLFSLSANADEISGEKIYKSSCLFCHGESGMGDGIASKKPENYFYPKNLNKTILSEEQVFLVAKHGAYYYGALKQDMPAWSVRHSDEELRAVAKYVKDTFKRENIKEKTK
jgi:mono/diheme cytochrome c family protein